MADRCRTCDRDGCEQPRIDAMDCYEFDAQDEAWVQAVREGCEENAVDWRARALAAEAKLPSDADRAALKTAAFELKERSNNYDAMLKRAEKAGSDPFVVTAYREGVAACEAAIAVVERLAKGVGA